MDDKPTREDFEKVRKEMGFISRKKVLYILRSELMKYKETHGKEYEIREGMEVIEDLK